MSLLWLKVAVLLYGVAALAVLPAALFDRPKWRHLAIPATVAAILFHFVSLAEMLNAAHHSLPVETHELQSMLALLLAGAFIAVYMRYRTVALGIFVLPISFLLSVLAAFRPGQEQLLPLRTGWIFLHIALLLAAYAALFVSLMASLLYLIQEHRLKTKAPSLAWLPPLDTTDEIALKSLLFGLPCMTGGLLIGSLVAQQTIGASYFLDPKILLAFAMWLAYCLMIFIRRHSGLRGRRAVYLSSFVFLVVITVWAANQFFRRPQVFRAMNEIITKVEPQHSPRASAQTLVLLGINHTTAPVEVRERLAVPAARLADATRTLLHQPGIREGLILSTCNRIELLTAQEARTGSVDLPRFLEEYFAVPAASLTPHLYEYREREAVRHVFRVASSLDSMVVGEPQILGQVKESYSIAREVGAVSSTLEGLLQRAFTVAKKVRTETEIGSSSVSIASVAVDLARKIFGSLQGKTVLLVGAGKMSSLAARHLIQQGASTILVTNRTQGRAEALAAEFLSTTATTAVLPFDQIYDQADRADIVITSTGAAEKIFGRSHGQQFLDRRRHRPMFFIDIAVPRDVDPLMNEVEGCFVYDIDDLQQVAQANLADRSREAEAAETIVTREVEKYQQRRHSLDAVPAILALQQNAEAIREAELARSAKRLGTLSADQHAAVEALTRSLTAKLLHPQLTALRKATLPDVKE